MRVIKKLNAGKPGTKIYQHQYGENLLCIRHRKNDETGEISVTVEIIVQRRLSRNLFNLQAYLDRDPDVLIGYEEHELRQKAKKSRSAMGSEIQAVENALFCDSQTGLDQSHCSLQ